MMVRMADTQPYRPRKRGYETMKDMLWSLGPIVVLIVAWVAFCGPQDDDVTVVDPASPIASAARGVDYDLLAPEPSDEWRTISAVVLKDGGTTTGLSLGYLTPTDAQARYVIASGSREEVLAEALGQSKPVDDPDGDATEIAGLSWVPVSTTSGRALVAEGDGFVVVVTGKASYAELRELAGSVHPA